MNRKIHVCLNENEDYQFEYAEGAERVGMLMPATPEAIAELVRVLTGIMQNWEVDPQETPLRYFKVEHGG